VGAEQPAGDGSASGGASRRWGLGGLLIALGAFPLAFIPGFPDRGWLGVAVFVVEIALIVIGAGLIWSARRR
jgi:hypothetical protein